MLITARNILSNFWSIYSLQKLFICMLFNVFCLYCQQISQNLLKYVFFSLIFFEQFQVFFYTS